MNLKFLSLHSMSFSDSLAVISIGLAVAFGIWQIYLALRRAKYPASITFVREQSVAILEDFATKIPNLSVLYKNVPIEKSVVLLSGHVINDGSLDITKEMTEKSLTCYLPEGCVWLEFKVTGTAPALNVESSIVDNNSAALTFGLFRRDESFSFQALVLVGSSNVKRKIKDFANEIQWGHRIASLGKVKTIQMPEQVKQNKIQRLIFKCIAGIVMVAIVFLGISQITGLGPLGKTPSIIYKGVKGGKETIVKITPNKNGSTTVKDLKTGQDTLVDLSSYTNSGTIVPIRTEKRYDFWSSIIFGSIVLVQGLFFLYTVFSDDYKRYRIRKRISVSLPES